MCDAPTSCTGSPLENISIFFHQTQVHTFRNYPFCIRSHQQHNMELKGIMRSSISNCVAVQLQLLSGLEPLGLTISATSIVPPTALSYVVTGKLGKVRIYNRATYGGRMKLPLPIYKISKSHRRKNFLAR